MDECLLLNWQHFEVFAQGQHARRDSYRIVGVEVWLIYQVKRRNKKLNQFESVWDRQHQRDNFRYWTLELSL